MKHLVAGIITLLAFVPEKVLMVGDELIYVYLAIGTAINVLSAMLAWIILFYYID